MKENIRVQVPVIVDLEKMISLMKFQVDFFRVSQMPNFRDNLSNVSEVLGNFYEALENGYDEEELIEIAEGIKKHLTEAAEYWSYMAKSLDEIGSYFNQMMSIFFKEGNKQNESSEQQSLASNKDKEKACCSQQCQKCECKK